MKATRKVGLIFDSTAIINEALIQKYDISFVSLNLAINNENFRSMDLDENQFKKEFLTYKSCKSGSPSPYDFEAAINAKFDQGYESVVVIIISSKLSATYNVALLGKEALTKERQAQTFIFDSLYASVGMDALMHGLEGFFDKDPSEPEIVHALEALRPQSTVLFELNDLKHLVKGRRLSSLKYLITLALKIRPLIEFKNGELNVIAQNRNRAKTLDVILGKIEELVKSFKHVYVSLFSYVPEDSIFMSIRDIINTRWPNIMVNMTNRIDPIFMTHVGINGYAVSVVSYN